MSSFSPDFAVSFHDSEVSYRLEYRRELLLKQECNTYGRATALNIRDICNRYHVTRSECNFLTARSNSLIKRALTYYLLVTRCTNVP